MEWGAGCETRGREFPVRNFNRLTTLSAAAAQLHDSRLYLPVGISHLFNRRGCLTADTGMPVAAGVRCLHLGCHLGKACRSGAGLLFGGGNSLQAGRRRRANGNASCFLNGTRN